MKTQWTTHKQVILFVALLVLPTISLAEDWEQIIKLLAVDRNQGARFGWSVSMSGDYAIIGATGDSFYTGAAYIFVRSGNSWVQQQKLVASDGDNSELFGYSVCISGEYAIIGAVYDHHNSLHGDSLFRAGSAYIFKRNGSIWIQQQKLVASDRHKMDFFGQSVSVSEDYAIVGSPNHIYDTTSVAFPQAGAAYIFKQTDIGWIQKQKLVSSPRQTCALFGCSVSISGDNLIIGAWREDQNPNFADSLNAGAAYIFKLNDSTWTQSQKLVVPDLHPSDNFGTSVFISEDYTIVGSFDHGYDTSNVFTNGAGAAYIFMRVDTNWIVQQKIFDPNRYLGHHFGYSVSLSGDYAIAGTYGTNYAYMFARSGSTWILEKQLMASDHANTADFGWAVSVSGEYSIVGAYSEWRDTSGGNTLSDAGAAYIYEHTSGTDVEQTEIGGMPRVFYLDQNYPNPFNPSTKIRFTIPIDERRETIKVSLIVYDLLGRKVVSLVDEEKSAGNYEVEFNTSSIKHQPSSGVYFYQLKTGDFIQTKKMIYMK